MLNTYTTKELEFITNNIELFKKELKERQIEKLNSFSFKAGDIIHRKLNNDNLFYKIKEIDKSDDTIVADEIVIRSYGVFCIHTEEWFDIDDFKWDEYVKIEDSEIFEDLFKIINKYNEDIKQLGDDTYLKLKNKIETLW